MRHFTCKKYRVLVGIFLCVFVLSFPSQLKAQDIHFSQYYFNPVLMNPAFTGFYRGQIRAALNYRKQWGFLPFPYISQTASIDSRLFSKKLNYNTFAIGACIINDRAGVGNLATQGAQFSSAVHINLLDEGRSTFAVGLQVGMMQTFFDPTVFVFGDQILNGTTSSAEKFQYTRIGYTDFNAGMLWTFQPSEKSNLYLGISANHVNKPTISFFNLPVSNQLSTRVNAQLGTVYSVTKKFDILPSFLYMNQLASSQLFFGSSAVYRVIEIVSLRAGTWVRVAGNLDAATLLLGADIKNLTIGFTYDVNLSSLKKVSKGAGGLELSLVYKEGKSYGRSRYKRPKPQITNCPVFDY